LTSDFLELVLSGGQSRRQLELLAGGGTMPVINGTVIRRLTIPLMPRSEQERLVERAQALADRISVEDVLLKKANSNQARAYGRSSHGTRPDAGIAEATA